MRRHVRPIGDLLKQRSHSAFRPDLICQSFRACTSRDFIVQSLASISQAPRQQHPLSWLAARRPFRANTPSHSCLGPSAKYSTSSALVKETSSLPLVIPKASDLPASSSTTSIKPLSSRRPLRKKVAEPWSQQEDDLLFELRQRGIGWKRISPQLNRPIASCYSRYYRFLDPFLADAVEGDAAEEEMTRSAIEASQRTLEKNVYKGLLEKARDQSGKPFPYLVQGPWTTLDRESLEQMIHQGLPWFVISRKLQRNQDSCKEKWLRIQQARLYETRQSKKIRGDQWTRLFREGFTPYHRDQLVREVEKHLKSSKTTRVSTLGFLEEDGEDIARDSSTFALMTTDAQNEHGSDIGNPAFNAEAIDWQEISKSFDEKFSADRLRTIYYEMAATKLIWTPEEDDRLTRAVIRLGPPELQPKIWSMIKEALGDVVRTSDDYKNRWRLLDMPQLEREWDFSEKKKFWQRWMELQRPGSLLALKPFLYSGDAPGESSAVHSYENVWDQIAEGLEYRHGRDCQLYFQQATFHFPKDPDLFQHLTYTIAKVYLKPRRIYWSPESLRTMVATVNTYLKANNLVRWDEVAKVLGKQYSAKQCETKWQYWSQQQSGKQLTKNARPDDFSEQQPDPSKQTAGSENGNEPSGSEETTPVSTADTIHNEPRLWTDRELELLRQGIREYGEQWAKIRDAFLPHRTVQMLHERHRRGQSKKTGRFSEKERNLLEIAIETYGEDADWALIASQVPGRTADQCRKNWKYSHTHHIHKLGEPWTAQGRERLKAAVARFGKRWTLVSEFVVGKTPDECRNEWREKVDNTVKSGTWSDEELNTMMERISEILSQREDKEQALLAEQRAALEQEDSSGEKKKTAFVDLTPRFKGKRKIDWDEVAKGMGGRTAQQCRLRFESHRRTFRIEEDVC